MKHILGLTAALLLGTTAAQAQTVINLAHVLGDTSSYQVSGERLKELLEEKSGGALTVQIFGNAALGGELRLAQGIRTGTVDMAFISTASLEGIVPEVKIFALPYLFGSKAETYEKIGGPLGQDLLAKFADYGMVGLGWGAVYERSMPSMKPINSVADVAGMKIRTIQSNGYVATYETLEMQPTPLAYGELFLALQNHIVDAAELAPDQTMGDGFGQVITDYALTRVHQLPVPLVAAPALMARLSDAEKAILLEVLPEALAAGVTAHNEATEAALVAMADKGIRVTEPDLAPFREKARASWPRIIAELPGGNDTVKAWGGQID